MSAHTKGRITFREDGEANLWHMATEDGRWWLALLSNGEQTSERQIANFRRLAACWNACQNIETEVLEQHALGVIAAGMSQQISEMTALLEQATHINPYGSVENAAVRDTAQTILSKYREEA